MFEIGLQDATNALVDADRARCVDYRAIMTNVVEFVFSGTCLKMANENKEKLRKFFLSDISLEFGCWLDICQANCLNALVAKKSAPDISDIRISLRSVGSVINKGGMIAAAISTSINLLLNAWVSAQANCNIGVMRENMVRLFALFGYIISGAMRDTCPNSRFIFNLVMQHWSMADLSKLFRVCLVTSVVFQSIRQLILRRTDLNEAALKKFRASNSKLVIPPARKLNHHVANQAAFLGFIIKKCKNDYGFGFCDKYGMSLFIPLDDLSV